MMRSFLARAAWLCVLLPLAVPADDDLLALYRDLHTAPELSLQEARTAARIADELAAAGYTVTRGVGGHGVVGVLANGPGPTLLLRADLDACPCANAPDCPTRAVRPHAMRRDEEVPVMHACGHDVHMTVLVGTARALAAARDTWRGTLVLIGQPAEELRAWRQGHARRRLVRTLPAPRFTTSPCTSAPNCRPAPWRRGGAVAANVDAVDLTVPGIGGHGAYPHMTRDPVMLAASIVMNLQTLVSRERDPLAPAVVTVGSIHGGTKHNIIPERVDLELTVRSFSTATRTLLLDGIARIAQGQARALGWPEERLPTMTIRDDYTPAVWNDPALAARLREVFAATFGADQLREVEPTMGGEDFARYGQVEPRIPSVLFLLGAVDPARYLASRRDGTALPSLHSAEFAPAAEHAIATGVTAMRAAALDLLRSPTP